MFICQECKEYAATYDTKRKSMTCQKCGHTELKEPTIEICTCGNEYISYTWFDPSGCSNCRRSFVD